MSMTFVADEMDVADDELRETIKMIWPLQAPKFLDLLVPRIEVLNKNNMTVGKIYAGLLILESWRTTRFGKKQGRLPVSFLKTQMQLYFYYARSFNGMIKMRTDLFWYILSISIHKYTNTHLFYSLNDLIFGMASFLQKTIRNNWHKKITFIQFI